ncbi:ubiquinone biosynthesis O-methyltransferase [Acrasis kona]|uniref:Ubiquinone biosynthesis O-methyltransferase n=1 Tax=Acrasis kona TaxID=1008807 RepID=A0AAW2YQ28_9EUKA
MTTVGVNETIKFLRGVLPNAPANVLEIGCGKGHVAKRLSDLGYTVTAIDTNESAIKFAQGLGVNAHVSNILKYQTDQKFDAIVGVRALHHVSDLSLAVTSIKNLLKSGGVFALEEFSRENIDHNTAKWYYDSEYLLEASGSIISRQNADLLRNPKKTPELEDTSPQVRWNNRHTGHQPPLHTGQDMLNEVLKQFGAESVRFQTAPYFFRYIISGIEDKISFDKVEKTESDANRLAELYLKIEEDTIEESKIKPMGVRISVTLRDGCLTYFLL